MNKKDQFWIEFIAKSKPKWHYRLYPYCLYLLARNGLECPVTGLDRMDWALATARALTGVTAPKVKKATAVTKNRTGKL